MLIKELFGQALNNVILKFWSQSEKEAILKIVHEIYHSDKQFTDDEKKDFNQQLASLGIDIDQVESLSVSNAVSILKADKIKKDLMYIILAEAIFKDEDYDKMEKSFVEVLIGKYGLDEDELKAQIIAKRDKILTDVLKGWVDEINDREILKK